MLLSLSPQQGWLAIETRNRVGLDKIQLHLVAEQITDVLVAVFNHRGTTKERESEHEKRGASERERERERGRERYRSSDRPQAITLTFSGKPMGNNISGRKIPELPTSTQRPSSFEYPKISIEGCDGSERRVEKQCTKEARTGGKTNLGIGVVSRLEFDLTDTNFLEESLNDTNQITKSKIIIGNETFNLVELSQVSCIK
jgi:hypothetical protein